MPLLIDELVIYANEVFPKITSIQIEDLIHLASYREAGLCASRGYGKTLISCIFETFMAERHWTVCHTYKNVNQATQWYKWMEELGWETTQWKATRGPFEVSLRLYMQGRGPRFDVVINDEVGTVILPREKKQFRACQHMLSGSPLGKSIWVGTQDPNSIWSSCKNQRIRGYNEEQMPWVKRAYELSVARDPKWSVDQEFHCLATPAGGLILQNVIIEDHRFTSQKYAIDSNPEVGYYVVGSHHTDNDIYLCEAYCFPTLQKLAEFVSTHRHYQIDIETNGVGSVVNQYLIEQNLPIVPIWVTEDVKMQKVKNVATHKIHIPTKYKEDVYNTLIKQIWGPDKKMVKFDDAHWFDAFYLSVSEGVSDMDFGQLQSNDALWEQNMYFARMKSRMR